MISVSDLMGRRGRNPASPDLAIDRSHKPLGCRDERGAEAADDPRRSADARH
jgi:hypothetical protein